MELLVVAHEAEASMRLVQQARALVGRGLKGDRYADGVGTFSSRGDHRPSFELPLIAAEVIEELTARDAALDFASTRRNVLTRGIDVSALVGRDFAIGGVRCRGQRLAGRLPQLDRTVLEGTCGRHVATMRLRHSCRLAADRVTCGMSRRP